MILKSLLFLLSLLLCYNSTHGGDPILAAAAAVSLIIIIRYYIRIYIGLDGGASDYINAAAAVFVN